MSIRFAAALLFYCAIAAPLFATEQTILLDFRSGMLCDKLHTDDARAALTAGPNGTALMVVTGREHKWPGVTLKAPGGRWDLSPFERVLLDVKNVGVERVNVHCRIDGSGAKSEFLSLTDNVVIEPGETRTMSIELRRRVPSELAKILVGMRGYPGGYLADRGINVGNVKQLIVFVSNPTTGHAFEVRGVRAAGKAPTPPRLPDNLDKLFPLIDQYGQYMHADWPGKNALGQ